MTPRHSNLFSHFLSAGMLTLAVVIAWQVVPKEYWLDWDMQRYVVQVKVGRCGNGSFSYMHNLLNTWLFGCATLLGRVTGEFDPLMAARLITVAAAGAAAWLVFLTIRLVTRRSFLAVCGGLAWFLVPGNLDLMRHIEDNAWANAFNAGMLYAIVRCEGSLVPGQPSRIGSLTWAVVSGLVLAVGINLHQQLAVTFYAFLAAVAVSSNHCWRSKANLVAVFVGTYWVASVLQNFVAIHNWAAMESLRRLVHQPYAQCFPNLWFFTSGKTLAEWADLVRTGLRWTYLHDGEVWPMFYCVVLCMAFAGLAVLYRHARLRGTFMFWRPTFGVLLLGGLILIHVPHSLLYEPMNIERWDATVPGMLVLGFYLVCALVNWVPESRRRIAYTVVCGVVIAVIVFDAFGTHRRLKCYDETYRGDEAVRWTAAVLRHVRDGGTVSTKDVVVLDPIMNNANDMQSRLTYAYPDLTVVTVDEGLQPIYSVGVYRELAFKLEGSVTSVKWPGGSVFHFMPLALESVRRTCPEFLERYPWRRIQGPDDVSP